jgi:hypothetical protein
VETRVVKTAHGRHLPIIAPGEEDELAGTLREQIIERVVTGSENRPPRRGLLGAPIERLDESEEVVELRSRPRVDEDLVGDPRMTRAESKRGVEVARLEDAEGVRDGSAGDL